MSAIKDWMYLHDYRPQAIPADACENGQEPKKRVEHDELLDEYKVKQ